MAQAYNDWVVRFVEGYEDRLFPVGVLPAGYPEGMAGEIERMVAKLGLKAAHIPGYSLTRNAVGATLMFARHCLVRENHATGNLRHGILLKQVESSRIIGNIVSGQNRGFFVQQAVQDHFENNLIMDNQIGLYLSGGSEENVFVRNSFVSNVDQVWQPSDEMDRGATASNRSAFSGGTLPVLSSPNAPVMVVNGVRSS